MQRPKKPKRQARHYSGKKKSHRRKHIVIAEKSRRILLITPAKPGRRHDKNLLDRAQITSILPQKVNAIGGMKRFGIMSQPLRNKIGLFDDRISRVSAGLWNFHLPATPHWLQHKERMTQRTPRTTFSLFNFIREQVYLKIALISLS